MHIMHQCGTSGVSWIRRCCETFRLTCHEEVSMNWHVAESPLILGHPKVTKKCTSKKENWLMATVPTTVSCSAHFAWKKYSHYADYSNGRFLNVQIDGSKGWLKIQFKKKQKSPERVPRRSSHFPPKKTIQVKGGGLWDLLPPSRSGKWRFSSGSNTTIFISSWWWLLPGSGAFYGGLMFIRRGQDGYSNRMQFVIAKKNSTSPRMAGPSKNTNQQWYFSLRLNQHVTCSTSRHVILSYCIWFRILSNHSSLEVYTCRGWKRIPGAPYFRTSTSTSKSQYWPKLRSVPQS